MFTVKLLLALAVPLHFANTPALARHYELEGQTCVPAGVRTVQACFYLSTAEHLAHVAHLAHERHVARLR